MGYRNDVALVIGDDQYDNLLDVPGVEDLLSRADRKERIGDGRLFFWKSVSWYGDEVDEMERYLSNEVPDDYYYYMRVGEDLEDIMIRGEWWDNPFDCDIERRIKFNSLNEKKSLDTVSLKAKNTEPSSTHCASCHSKLKDPMPGCPNLKYCPVCEP